MCNPHWRVHTLDPVLACVEQNMDPKSLENLWPSDRAGRGMCCGKLQVRQVLTLLLLLLLLR